MHADYVPSIGAIKHQMMKLTNILCLILGPLVLLQQNTWELIIQKEEGTVYTVPVLEAGNSEEEGRVCVQQNPGCAIPC